MKKNWKRAMLVLLSLGFISGSLMSCKDNDDDNNNSPEKSDPATSTSFVSQELFDYTLTGADIVTEMGDKIKDDKVFDANDIHCYSPAKISGVLPELYIAGPYFYAQNAGFFITDSATGIGLYYYGADAELGYVSGDVRSYISIGAVANETTAQEEDLEDVTVTDEAAKSIKVTVNAQRFGTGNPFIAILDKDNKCIAVSDALTDEAADYTFIVPKNAVFRITNGATAGGQNNIIINAIKGETSDTEFSVTDGVAKVVSVTVSGKDTVESESSILLTAKVTVKAGAENTVTWSSSNPAVATVSDDGTVTAAAGITEDTEVTIKATSTFDSSKYGEKTITVTKKSEVQYQTVTWDFTGSQMSSVNIQTEAGIQTEVAGYEGTTESTKKMTVEYVGTDGNKGKLAYNSSGYAQFNKNTQITIPVVAGDIVTITAFPGQGKYSIVCGDTTLEPDTVNNEKTVTATADGNCVITATGGAYFYSIEYKHPKATTNYEWDFTTSNMSSVNIQTEAGDTTDVYAYVGTTASDTVKMTVEYVGTDGNKGKLAYNSSGYAQFNKNTQITIPVVAGDIVTITAFPGQGKYSIVCGDTTLEPDTVNNEKTVTATADGNCVITATGGAYFYSIVLSRTE